LSAAKPIIYELAVEEMGFAALNTSYETAPAPSLDRAAAGSALVRRDFDRLDAVSTSLHQNRHVKVPFTA
jgi:hypothetical protein